MHPSELYPGLPVRLSTTHPETEYKAVQWARVWYVSERRPGAVMLVTWHARRRAPMPDDQYDKLWQIVNRRYTQRLPTLITSNLDRNQLRDQTDSKLVGRLAEMCVIVEMAGADLREYDGALASEDDGR